MAMIIEKRTRSLVTDDWGSWAVTTEAPDPVNGYVDTTLVEYRADDGKTSIEISNVTRNVTVSSDVDDDSKYVAVGDGYFDDLMESVNMQLKAQHDSGRLTGPIYAQVYLGMMQSTLAQAMMFNLNKREKEIQTDTAAIAFETADSTQDDKIAISGFKREVEETNRDIAVGTEANKIALVAQQLAKLTADTEYVGAQQLALEEQVEDNRLIKSIDALGDTFGTFGAGGLTVSSDMWGTYFGMITDLTTIAAPTSTTVSKVV